MWYEYPGFVWGLLVDREFCHCSSFFWLRGAAPLLSLRTLGRSRSHMFGMMSGGVLATCDGLGTVWVTRSPRPCGWMDEAPRQVSDRHKGA